MGGELKACGCFDGPYSEARPDFYVSVRCRLHRDEPALEGYALMYRDAPGRPSYFPRMRDRTPRRMAIPKGRQR